MMMQLGLPGVPCDSFHISLSVEKSALTQLSHTTPTLELLLMNKLLNQCLGKVTLRSSSPVSNSSQDSGIDSSPCPSISPTKSDSGPDEKCLRLGPTEENCDVSTSSNVASPSRKRKHGAVKRHVGTKSLFDNTSTSIKVPNSLDALLSKKLNQDDPTISNEPDPEIKLTSATIPQMSSMNKSYPLDLTDITSDDSLNSTKSTDCSTYLDCVTSIDAAEILDISDSLDCNKSLDNATSKESTDSLVCVTSGEHTSEVGDESTEGLGISTNDLLPNFDLHLSSIERAVDYLDVESLDGSSNLVNQSLLLDDNAEFFVPSSLLPGSALLSSLSTALSYDVPSSTATGCFSDSSPTSSISTSSVTPQLGGSHQCALCPNSSFATRTVLNRHIQTIHNASYEWPCHICGTVFKRKDSVYGHIQQVHNFKMWPCKLCGKVFKRKDRLRTHVNNVHAAFGSSDTPTEETAAILHALEQRDR